MKSALILLSLLLGVSAQQQLVSVQPVRQLQPGSQLVLQKQQPGSQVGVGPNQGQFVFDLYKNVPPLDSEQIIDLMAVAQPGVSFPVNAVVPNTGFDCAQQGSVGYFADPSPPSLCQAFYRCDVSGNQTGFLCPNQTLFNQLTLTCDYYWNVDCAGSKNLYGYANTRLYQPNQPLFDTPPQGYISRLSGLSEENGASVVIANSAAQSQATGRTLNVNTAQTVVPIVAASNINIQSSAQSPSIGGIVGAGAGPGALRPVVNVVPVNVVSAQNTRPIVTVLGVGTGASTIVNQRPLVRPVVVPVARGPSTTTTTTTTTPTTTTTEETTTEAETAAAPATEVTALVGSSVGASTLNGQPVVSTVLVPVVPVATVNSGVVVQSVGIAATGSQVSSSAVSSSEIEQASATESSANGGVTIVVQPANNA